MILDNCSFEAPADCKGDADYGYFLNANAPPFELNESTGFSPQLNKNVEFIPDKTQETDTCGTSISETFATAIKDLMGEEGKSTSENVTVVHDHVKKGIEC